MTANDPQDPSPPIHTQSSSASPLIPEKRFTTPTPPASQIPLHNQIRSVTGKPTQEWKEQEALLLPIDGDELVLPPPMLNFGRQKWGRETTSKGTR
jgi:hypothetical protein